ncbi:hypothetical protein DYQ86_27485 [Acidobacteria bacterium AB60]|nr:hypothetical protein DYQ86_27485 [Acidobacteria bacterium AB60]
MSCFLNSSLRSLLGMLIFVIAVMASFAQTTAGSPAGTSFGLNLKSFGAVGDCHHDDTSALQSAVNQINGRTLLLPAGCYLIAQPIRVPFAQGFRIVGEGRVGTKIQQQSDNTPILVFTQDLTWGWEVSNLEFSWSKPQPNQNTNATAILFAAPGGKGGLFNFTISHVTFDNGFRGIDLAPGKNGSQPVWGFVLEEIIAETQMSGATIHLSPNPTVGMPRCILRDIYSSQASSEPQITLNHCTSATLDGIEDNNGVDTSLDLTSNEAMSVRDLHIEHHQMAQANRPVIKAENSNVDFSGITAALWSEIPGDFYLISNVAGGGSLGVSNALLRGVHPKNPSNIASTHTHLLHLNGPLKLAALNGIVLSDSDMNRADDTQTAAKIGSLGKVIE